MTYMLIISHYFLPDLSAEFQDIFEPKSVGITCLLFRATFSVNWRLRWI